jgi:hypothetical protein
VCVRAREREREKERLCQRECGVAPNTTEHEQSLRSLPASEYRRGGQGIRGENLHYKRTAKDWAGLQAYVPPHSAAHTNFKLMHLIRTMIFNIA